MRRKMGLKPGCNPQISAGRPLHRLALCMCVPLVLALSLLLPFGNQSTLPLPVAHAAMTEPLHLDVFTANDDSWGVTSTVIYGKTEAILVDGQYFNSQAKKVADRVDALGRKLNAIIITHPDLDHYMGLEVLHQRFPSAKIYMTAAAVEAFKGAAEKAIARQKKSAPAEAPDSLPTPEVLPTTFFLVDGQAVQVIEDFQGDVLKPMNSFLWVPSLEAVIAGDIVFNGIHPWLADSDEQTRNAWQQSLAFISSLHPRIVVPGHKGDPNLPNSVDAVASMRKYLSDFDAAKKAATNADGLIAAMKQKYPKLKVEKFLGYAAKAAFPAPPAQ